MRPRRAVPAKTYAFACTWLIDRRGCSLLIFVRAIPPPSKGCLTGFMLKNSSRRPSKRLTNPPSRKVGFVSSRHVRRLDGVRRRRSSLLRLNPLRILSRRDMRAGGAVYVLATISNRGGSSHEAPRPNICRHIPRSGSKRNTTSCRPSNTLTARNNTFARNSGASTPSTSANQ